IFYVAKSQRNIMIRCGPSHAWGISLNTLDRRCLSCDQIAFLMNQLSLARIKYTLLLSLTYRVLHFEIPIQQRSETLAILLRLRCRAALLLGLVLLHCNHDVGDEHHVGHDGSEGAGVGRVAWIEGMSATVSL